MELDLAHLYKLRAAVGRYGEMDRSGWWNTKEVLGARGAVLYRRGLPRTHFFTRVRLVSRVARARSGTIYPAPGVATLWELPPEIERALAFEERSWAANGDNGPEWKEFESALATPPDGELIAWLADLDLIHPDRKAEVQELSLAPGGRGVEVPGPLTPAAVELLAGAHTLGSPGELIVPFVPNGLGEWAEGGAAGVRENANG